MSENKDLVGRQELLYEVFFFYASSEKNCMLACRFDEHRDNSRNLQSVFLVVGEHLKKLQYHAPVKIPSQSSKGDGLY